MNKDADQDGRRDEINRHQAAKKEKTEGKGHKRQRERETERLKLRLRQREAQTTEGHTLNKDQRSALCLCLFFCIKRARARQPDAMRVVYTSSPALLLQTNRQRHRADRWSLLSVCPSVVCASLCLSLSFSLSVSRSLCLLCPFPSVFSFFAAWCRLISSRLPSWSASLFIEFGPCVQLWGEKDPFGRFSPQIYNNDRCRTPQKIIKRRKWINT
jgi:hypothetical protein